MGREGRRNEVRGQAKVGRASQTRQISWAQRVTSGCTVEPIRLACVQPSVQVLRHVFPQPVSSCAEFKCVSTSFSSLPTKPLQSPSSPALSFPISFSHPRHQAPQIPRTVPCLACFISRAPAPGRALIPLRCLTQSPFGLPTRSTSSFDSTHPCAASVGFADHRRRSSLCFVAGCS